MFPYLYVQMDLTEIGDKESEETLQLAAKAYLEHIDRESKTADEEADSESPVKKPKIDPNDLSYDQLVAHAPVQVEKPKIWKVHFEQEDQPQPGTSSENLDDNKPDDNQVPSSSSSNDLSNSPSSPPHFDNDNRNNHQAIPSNRSPTYVEHVLNAVGHPTVLKQVALQFLNNIKQKTSSD